MEDILCSTKAQRARQHEQRNHEGRKKRRMKKEERRPEKVKEGREDGMEENTLIEEISIRHKMSVKYNVE